MTSWPRRSRPTQAPRRRRRHVATAAAVLLATGAFATPAAARPVDPPPGGATTAASRAAGPAAAAAAVPMRRDCGVGATTVTPAKALQLNMIYAGVASIERTGVTLDVTHRGITYIDGVTQGRVTTEHYLANSGGRLYLLTVRTTRDANGNATGTLRKTVVGSRGWGDARILTYSKPYLYVLTDGGAFRRYLVGSTYGASRLVTLSRSGWSSVRTLGRGVPWIVGTDARGNELIDDVFVSLTNAGQLLEYHVPRNDPTRWRRYVLRSSGWGGMRYVAAGTCETGNARPLLGITRTGDVYGYMDADDTDLSGRDIRSAGRLATGWLGSFSD